MVLALVPRRWWRRSPFLPLPDRDWMAFRLETAYGDPGHRPERGDLRAVLAWSAAFARHRRARRRAASPL